MMERMSTRSIIACAQTGTHAHTPMLSCMHTYAHTHTHTHPHIRIYKWTCTVRHAAHALEHHPATDDH